MAAARPIAENDGPAVQHDEGVEDKRRPQEARGPRLGSADVPQREQKEESAEEALEGLPALEDRQRGQQHGGGQCHGVGVPRGADGRGEAPPAPPRGVGRPTGVLLRRPLLVATYETPVPGRPTLAVRRPLLLTVKCAPRTPVVTLTLFLFRLRDRPGRSLIRRWKRNGTAVVPFGYWRGTPREFADPRPSVVFSQEAYSVGDAGLVCLLLLPHPSLAPSPEPCRTAGPIAGAVEASSRTRDAAAAPPENGGRARIRASPSGSGQTPVRAEAIDCGHPMGLPGPPGATPRTRSASSPRTRRPSGVRGGLRPRRGRRRPLARPGGRRATERIPSRCADGVAPRRPEPAARASTRRPARRSSATTSQAPGSPDGLAPARRLQGTAVRRRPAARVDPSVVAPER